METREKVCIKYIYTLISLSIPPHDRWILAQYDVDVFDYKTNRTVEVYPLNEGVDITEVDYSRKEVEVCCECLFCTSICVCMCMNVAIDSIIPKKWYCMIPLCRLMNKLQHIF